MKRYVIIKDGVVLNAVEYETQPIGTPAGFEEGAVAIPDLWASVGWTYADGVFTEPQPYPSWTLVSNVWEPPTARPSNNGWYHWDEETQAWVDALEA